MGADWDVMTSSSLRGQVVVITGGARGIGYATARTLIERGARVAIGDIDETRLLAAADELGLEVTGRLDVTDGESFRAFYSMVSERLGTPDVLINNAGIMPVGPTLEEPEEAARRMVDINLHGVITGTKIALASMLPRRNGHIINIASMAGEAFVPGAATYCATKAAVIAFTEAVRLEHRTSGVSVSLVLPTFTNTELVAGTTGPRGFRNAEPEEIADAIAGLLERPRPRAYVTRVMGQVLAAQRFMPRSVAEGLARRLGGEQMFLAGVDPSARQAYEQRAGKS
ncbi:oxidoreductase, short chain dehydrogenase/reductase family protein [Aeromicrobium marinum DSM 15272]|uniref:Oxidoreductase, short chain dehydrogenase/reductase family protein n=2 Tax=Aeromicrobium marinum TaxID=219314 RepID=E2S8A2_9ACTN|nr:oxidoreductase, short chain dehydrogenase/reductase family protein [Aeromicrobium marinum DSM 15272]